MGLYVPAPLRGYTKSITHLQPDHLQPAQLQQNHLQPARLQFKNCNLQISQITNLQLLYVGWGGVGWGGEGEGGGTPEGRSVARVPKGPLSEALRQKRTKLQALQTLKLRDLGRRADG